MIRAISIGQDLLIFGAFAVALFAIEYGDDCHRARSPWCGFEESAGGQLAMFAVFIAGAVAMVRQNRKRVAR